MEGNIIINEPFVIHRELLYSSFMTLSLMNLHILNMAALVRSHSCMLLTTKMAEIGTLGWFQKPSSVCVPFLWWLGEPKKSGRGERQ